MKVIYSYTNPGHPDFIPIEVLHIGILSAINSNLLYGNSTFSSNETLITKFKEIGLPFTDYEVTPHIVKDGTLPYIPKLLTYTDQNSPFIHLDLDLILFENLQVLNNEPVKFAHRDIKVDWDLSSIDGVYNAYLHPAYHFTKLFGNEYLRDIKLYNIPNMGVVQCQDIDTFRHATNKALEIYYANQTFFDSNWMTGCFLEQGLIHKYLMDISPEYHHTVFYKLNYAYDKPILLFTNEENSKVKVDEWYNGEQLYFKSTEDLIKNYNFDTLPAVHFLGGSKYSKHIQFLVIREILKELDIEILEKVQLYFGSEDSSLLEEYKSKFL